MMMMYCPGDVEVRNIDYKSLFRNFDISCAVLLHKCGHFHSTKLVSLHSKHDMDQSNNLWISCNRRRVVEEIILLK